MPKRSAGILLFRRTQGELEVLLVHPGGPYWAKKDASAWSVPKGEYAEGEDPLETARREFGEETGGSVEGKFVDLGEVKQGGGKLVRAWAVEGDFDPTTIRSNTFPLEWPPKSGVFLDVPEVDVADWFPIPEARAKINPAQAVFLDRLAATVKSLK